MEFRHPHDELAQLEASTARADALAGNTTVSNVNLEAINFSYRVSVEKGRPLWTPVQIFDDGRKTFIRFPAAMLNIKLSAWGRYLGDPTLAVAILDRATMNAIRLDINGPSYRQHVAEERALKRGAKLPIEPPDPEPAPQP